MSLEKLLKAIEPSRTRVVKHPIYQSISCMEDVQRFQSQHVFAVWDFMCLLKRLQRDLTCTYLPWLPQGDPQVRRLINEIVVEEESGDNRRGGFLSHFELYRLSMIESGADTSGIDQFVFGLQSGQDVYETLHATELLPSTSAFVKTTWSFVVNAKTHEAAAAFTFGREEVIPDMFRNLLDDLNREFPGKVTRLRDYLDLHIELDGDHHGKMAMAMLQTLCAEDEQKWQEAEVAARKALDARFQLWEGLVNEKTAAS